MCGCACAHTMFLVVSTLANMWTIVMKTQSQYETTGPLSLDVEETGNNKELHSPKERKLTSLTQD